MHKTTVVRRHKNIFRYGRTVLSLALALLLFARYSSLSAYGETSVDVDSHWRWSNINRVVVIADIHGAFPQLVSLLKTNRLIDDSLHWIGADAHLVSVGDLIDRGADSRKVLDLLMRLQQEAQGSGGRVHVLAGNHELMNLIGDYRYVSKEEFAAFAEEESAAERRTAYRAYLDQETLATADRFLTGRLPRASYSRDQLRRQFKKNHPPGYFGYRQAFSTEGRYGQWLLSLPAVIVVNGTAFAHGGLPEITTKLKLKELNEQYQASVKQFLDLWHELMEDGIIAKNSTRDPVVVASEILKLHGDRRKRGRIAPEILDKIQSFVDVSHSPFHSSEGPLWYRGAVLCRNIQERPILTAALENLGAKRVVVGHTVTRDSSVHEIHNGKLIMLDTGMLEPVYHGRPASLLINGNNEVSVQYINPVELADPVVENRISHYGLTAGQLSDSLSEGEISRIDKKRGIPWRVKIEYNNRTIQAVFYPPGKKGKAQHELAAYQLDQLIGLDLIPLTVEREIDGVPGALQLRFKDTLSESQRQAKNKGFDGWCPMPRQFQLMYVMDILSDNRGRTGDNVLYDAENWILYLTDFKSAFGKGKKIGATGAKVLLSPGVKSGLSSLTATQLQEALGEWLNGKQIKALLSRRDQILEKFASSEF